MGRHAGHIAIRAGLAGGASLTLVPERPFDIDSVCESILRRHQRAKKYATIVVVAEGAEPVEGTLDLGPRENDQFGHIRLGGIAQVVADEIERAPATRPGSPSSATSSAAAPRPRSTGCSRPATASPPSTRCTTVRSDRWWRSTPTDRPCRSARCNGPAQGRERRALRRRLPVLLLSGPQTQPGVGAAVVVVVVVVARARWARVEPLVVAPAHRVVGVRTRPDRDRADAAVDLEADPVVAEQLPRWVAVNTIWATALEPARYRRSRTAWRRPARWSRSGTLVGSGDRRTPRRRGWRCGGPVAGCRRRAG
jgi:hypothetical protein